MVGTCHFETERDYAIVAHAIVRSLGAGVLPPAGAVALNPTAVQGGARGRASRRRRGLANANTRLGRRRSPATSTASFYNGPPIYRHCEGVAFARRPAPPDGTAVRGARRV